METKKIVKLSLGLLVLAGIALFIFLRTNDNGIGLSKINPGLLKTAIVKDSNPYATLSLSPASSMVHPEGDFSLEAKVNPNGGAGINAVTMTINYPVSGIECSSFTADASTWMTFLPGTIDNTAGTAVIDVSVQMDDRDGITTETTVATLTCKAKTTGDHSLSFDETKTAVYSVNESTTGSVLKSTSSATVDVTTIVTSPTVTSVTFSPTSISAGQTSLLSWDVIEAEGIYGTCKGSDGTVIPGLDDVQVPTSTMTSLKTSPYEDLIAYGNKITCTLSAYKGTTKSTESKSATLTLASSSTYSCTGTTPTNATLCSSDDSSLTANTEKTLVASCTSSAKCEYACNSNYSYNSTTKTCISTTLPTLKVSFINSETDTTELTTAVQNGTKAVRYQLTGYNKDAYDWFFKFSLPITIDGTTISTETWSQMPDSDHPETIEIKTPFTFSTTTTGDFYADIKIVAQGAGSSGTAVYSSQSNRVNITASSSTIVNGACGSSSGQSYSSAPSSGLCSLGTASAVSGSGPWTWTCSGSGGGTNVSCSANKSTTPTPTTSYTYSPTTSVIPVTEYTYSYTSKVAPASGPVTNVILLLSVSAAITLGVWVVMKKIKG